MALLMIEFQSSQDKWMAVRVMAYQALLYQDLIRHKRAGRPGDLPAVVAIVLYNGDEPWKAAQEILELIGKVPDGIRRYLPRLRFILVDIGRLAPSELEQKGNLAVQVLRLERSSSPQELRRELEILFEELEKPGRSEVKRAFLTWLRRVLLPSRFPGLQRPELGPEEKSAMLEERVKKWTRQWKAEGRQEGLRRGRKEGHQAGLMEGLKEGAAATLIRLLEHKFGSLAANHRKRIQKADSNKLQEWTLRIFAARRPEEIFEPVGPDS